MRALVQSKIFLSQKNKFDKKGHERMSWPWPTTSFQKRPWKNELTLTDNFISNAHGIITYDFLNFILIHSWFYRFVPWRGGLGAGQAVCGHVLTGVQNLH
jgi:hypothetical protein